MPAKIALITDSTCDIPTAWIEQYAITIVPLTIAFGSQQYLDGLELTAKQFYQRLPVDPHHPTTSQPTPKAFLEAYQRAASAGAEQILVLTISAAMSGTVESARQAASDFELPVTVVNSCNNSMGLGWQVIAAARARDEHNANLEEMVASAAAVRERIVYYVTLDTIEFLSRGGRIADAVRFLDSFLRIKPLIYVKPESGSVGASIPSRTRAGSLEGLFREYFRHIDTTRPLHLTVVHNDAEAEAQAMADRVREAYHPAELFVTITSPVLGAHTGPRAVGLVGYSEP